VIAYGDLARVGTPVGGAKLRADPETGELLVRGPMLMRGYWQDDELTRSTVVDGWLRTGDLGAVDADGTWWFHGRLKDVIVRRTSKITPGEVESAIDEHRAPGAARAGDLSWSRPDDRQADQRLRDPATQTSHGTSRAAVTTARTIGRSPTSVPAAIRAPRAASRERTWSVVRADGRCDRRADGVAARTAANAGSSAWSSSSSAARALSSCGDKGMP
jgi:acyl-CoA synthetase (AMP-forming)/AMP-acid ligase II